ncbi:MAG: T9SS type A sorting domain-containing protein [Flammeovirgaceae bacterium]|nr:T9SS type A sorting domain-containing protein [Flammeovirgaceae bacterium]
MRKPAKFNGLDSIIQSIFTLKNFHYFLSIFWLIFLLHGEIHGIGKETYFDPENPPKVEIILPNDSMIVYGDYVEILYTISGDSADYARIKLTLDYKNSVNTNSITGKFIRPRLDTGYHHAKLELLDAENNPLANPESSVEITFYLEEKIPVPENLSANLTDPYHSQITWEKVPGLIDYYLIEEADSINGIYTVLDSVTIQESSYIHHVPNPETIHFYRVKAIYQELESEYSTSDFIKTNGLPQMESFSKTIEEDSILSFSKIDFTNNFSDPNLDSLKSIKILSLVEYGQFLENGKSVGILSEIGIEQLNKLTFQADENWFGGLSIPISFSDGIHYAKDTAWINIAVTSVNDAPTLLFLDNLELDENNEPGKVIGHFSAQDVEDDKLVFSLAKTEDFIHFKIKDDQLLALDSFDYEVKNIFTITTIVKDQNGGELMKSFEIKVNNLQENTTNDTQEPQIPTGINDFQELSGVSIYPNPFTNRINLEINNDLKGQLQVLIMDLTGKIIYQNEIEKSEFNTSKSFDFSEMNPGLYIVKISNLKYRFVSRILKQ